MKRVSLLLGSLPCSGLRLGLALALSLSLGAAACRGEPAGGSIAAPAAAPATETPRTAATTAATQTVEGGQVTVAVTWNGPDAGPDFHVVMDTHAVDLDGYDLRQLTLLRTSRGEEIQPIDWTAPPGGHHRVGSLRFPATGPSGRPVIEPGGGTLELIIRDVAGIPERAYRWTL